MVRCSGLAFVGAFNTYSAAGWSSDASGGSSRIGFMLVNTLAQSSLSSAETCCDLFVGQHRALRLCFNLSAFRTMESKFVKPKVFELPPLPHDVNAKRTQLAHEVDLAQGLLDAGPKEGDSFSSVGSCGVDSTIWLQHSWLVCAAWVLVLHLT